MLIFVVAIFVLPSMGLGFWLGKRARVARMHCVGAITAGAEGVPVAQWSSRVLPLGALLYVDDKHGVAT